jgi:hypothetical protein
MGGTRKETDALSHGTNLGFIGCFALIREGNPDTGKAQRAADESDDTLRHSVSNGTMCDANAERKETQACERRSAEKVM